MEKIPFNVIAPENGVITVLTGKALDPVSPLEHHIVGDINSVPNFLKIRTNNSAKFQALNLALAVLTVDFFNRSVKLELDPSDKFATTITGKLEESNELKTFGINTAKRYNKGELINLVKFNRIFFENPEKADDLKNALMKLTTAVNLSSNDSADDRGNKEISFIKKVETDIPTDFILDVPIWANFPPSKFRVEICLDVTEGSVRFWLESVELHQLKQESLDKIIKDVVAQSEGIVTIYK